MKQSIDLKFDGADLPKSLSSGLQSVTLSDAMDQLDELEARFWIVESTKSSDLQLHGVPFKATVVSGDEEREIAGDVVEVSFERQATGLVMEVRGLSTLHRLKRLRASKAHEGTHSDVAKAVASNAKLGADVEGVQGSAQIIIQANETDASFLERLARENNYVVRVDEKKVRFVRPDSAGEGAKIKVEWNDIASFRVTHSLDGILSGVKVLGHDSKPDEAVEAEAKASDVAKITGSSLTGPGLVEEKFGAAVMVLDNSTIINASQAKARAKAELQRRAEQFVQGSFATGLTAAARSGGKVEIDKAPWPLSGTFIIREVVHSYHADEGYSSRISFISDSLKNP